MDTTVTIELASVARDLGLAEFKVLRTVELLDEGNTVPFITRYRKDQTGGLDEEQIRQVQDSVARLRMLAERKRTILKSIDAQGKLTADLAEKIKAATTTKRLEDLYLPFKPKKQTLATIARERGLEPLAREILGAETIAEDLDRRALDFVDVDKGLRSQADVLLGVGHLIAENYGERADVREALRKILKRSGKIVCSRIETAEGAADTESEGGEHAEGDIVDVIEYETSAEEPALPVTEEPLDAPPMLDDETEAAPTAPESLVDGEAPAELPAPVAAAVEPLPDDAAPPEAHAAAASAEHATEVDPTLVHASESADSEQSLPDFTNRAAGPEDEESQKAKAARAAKDAALLAAATLSAPQRQAKLERKLRKAEAKQRKKKQQESAYKDYFNFHEAIAKLPPHRILAINRGERARVLRVKVDADFEAMRQEAESMLITENHPHADFLRGCLKDALQRLIYPALDREVRRELTDKAEEHAVQVFARNLRKLLLQPPVASHRVLAIDPGFKSGCKLVALDEFGEVHGQGTIYLIGGDDRRTRSRSRMAEMIKVHKITVVAIGNGTACRETENLLAEVLANELKDHDVAYVIVNEAGASVYSTSPLGREELGSYDPSMRSAISIGRRLLDPLSELVKISPANIGVGLYQHDMKAKHLQASLDAVVESCVNYVGVDVNTASPALLRYVSGLNQLTARRLYEYRREHGPIHTREQLHDVPGFGEATFIQAAGFLKIFGGNIPLDGTWIHPESYDVARKILAKLDASEEDIARLLPRKKVRAEAAGEQPAEPSPVEEATSEESAGESAPPEIVADSPEQPTPPEVAPEAPDASSGKGAAASPAEITKPDGEPAEESEADESYKTEVPPPKPDEAAGEEASQLSPPAPEKGVTEEEPAPSLLAQRVSQVEPESFAKELDVGEHLLRDILTSLKRPGRDPREDLPPPIFRREILKLEDLKPGMELTGTVLNVVDFGAFVDIGLHDSGLVHISRLADRYIKDPHEVVGVGDILHVWVVEVDKGRRRVSLTAIKPGTQKAHEHAPREKKEKFEHKKQDRPPQRARSEGQGQGRGGRRRPEKTHGGGQGSAAKKPAATKTFTPRPKPKPAKPITKAMKEGREPLRTFGDLKQFFELKTEEPPKPAPEPPPEQKPEGEA